MTGRLTRLAVASAAILAALGACRGEKKEAEGKTASDERQEIFERRAESPGEEKPKVAEEAGSEQQKEQLEALGYLETTEDADERAGVITHDRERAESGVNLFLAEGDQQVWLVDMDGTLLHRWWLGVNLAHAQLDEGGGLLALRKNRRLFKLDERSRVLWSASARAHHDVEPSEEGYVLLSREIRRVSAPGGELPVLADTLVWMDERGVKEREIPLLDLFMGDIPEARFNRVRAHWKRTKAREAAEVPEAAPGLLERRIMYGTLYDVFHTNSVEVIERPIEGVAEAGDVLISLREIDTVAILDPDAPAVRWKWGPGEIEEQHHATIVEGGHVLLFDNGVHRGRSRVIEVDPRTEKIVWEYAGAEGEEFFSKRRGSAQRLPGGNTLIGLGDRGRLLEVTPGGDVVWSYWLPKANEDERQATYRVERILGGRADALRRRFGED